MKKLPLFLALAAVAVAGCGDDETVVNPPPTAKNGSLFFSTAITDDFGNVAAVNEDGSNRRTVISKGSIVTSVSKSGRALALTVDTATGAREVVVIDLSGNVLATVPTADKPQTAVLSPDGKKVCYSTYTSSFRDCALHLVNVDGTGDVLVTENGAWEGVLAFSPDSRMLAFYTEADGLGKDKLYVVNSDGTGMKMLTDRARSINDNFGGLCWSPAGTKLLYMRLQDTSGNPANDQNDIWSIAPDGTGATNLTADIDGALFPEFSPDGSTILFSGGNITTASIDLWTMKADGSGKRNLTNTPGMKDVEAKAQWSPDGKKIACISFDIEVDDDAYLGRLKVVDATTGASTFLTETASVFNCFWSTAP